MIALGPHHMDELSGVVIEQSILASESEREEGGAAGIPGRVITSGGAGHLTAGLHRLLAAEGFVYCRRMENRIRRRNGLPVLLGA